MCWLEQPHPGARPMPVDERLLTEAFRTGAATEADVIAAFLYPRSTLFRDLTVTRAGSSLPVTRP